MENEIPKKQHRQLLSRSIKLHNKNSETVKNCKEAAVVKNVLLPLLKIVLTRIGLLSDTHHFLDDNIFEHFKECDEIWHAGDFGSNVADKLATYKPLRGVYGNIDNTIIRSQYPEQIIFTCEKVKVLIKHIGGYPPKYNIATKPTIINEQPQLFISGHSHILKIMYDDKLGCLHMNPGAAGKQGWHKVRTLIRFIIDGAEMKNCEVIEL